MTKAEKTIENTQEKWTFKEIFDILENAGMEVMAISENIRKAPNYGETTICWNIIIGSKKINPNKT